MRRWLYACAFAVALTPGASVAADGAQPDAFAACEAQFARAPADYESAYCFYQVAATQRDEWDGATRRLGALQRAHPANHWLAVALGHLQRSRDPIPAERLYREAADAFRLEGQAEGEVLARSSLRDLLFPSGRVVEAAREVERVIAVGETTRDPLVKARALTLEANHLQDTGGDLRRAFALIAQAERLLGQEAPYRLRRTTLTALGSIAFRLGRVADALEAFQRLDTLAAGMREGRVQASAQYNILNTLMLRETMLPTPGARDRLIDLANRALDTAEASGHLEIATKVHRALGDLQSHDPALRADAMRHTRRCLALAGSLRIPHDEAACAWLEASLLYASHDRRAVKARPTSSTADDPWRAVKDGPTNAEMDDAGRAVKARPTDRETHNARRAGLYGPPVTMPVPTRVTRAVARARARAEQATARANNPRTRAFSAARRMRLSWDTAARSVAIADSFAAIDAIEALRARQDDEEGTSALFSAWTEDYAWLSGRLLQTGSPADVDLAFAVGERARARTLLDGVLGVPRATSAAATAGPNNSLEDVAAIQRRLMRSRVDEHERRTLVQRLEAIEQQEHLARRRVAVGPLDETRESPFAGILDVQATLAADEALLAFHVGLWSTYEGAFGGGSWLIAITRHTRAVYALPDRTQLATMVPVFGGLLRGGDRMPTAVPTDAAGRLYQDVLARPLGDLPPAITRLVLIPDGPLQQLPFDVLTPGANVAPLAARYTLTLAPSATLWRHWQRQAVTASGSGRTLVIADPQIAHGVEHLWPGDASQPRLARLPYAAVEARSIASSKDQIAVLTNRRASEHALKSLRLQDYDILHIAAHAMVDRGRPERSAILLAPGDAREDGLLQPREIETLNLAGRIIVLSACQSASGTVVSGEGMMSLGRAFFAAGARAVIGSRWPIRDRDAAAFFERFYRHLHQGASLAEALMQTKIDAIAEGQPPSAWSGIVVLGDGSLRPFRANRAAPGIHATASAGLDRVRWLLAVGLVGIALASVVSVRRVNGRE